MFRSLAIKSFSTLFFNFTIRFIGIISSIVVVRLLTKDDFGLLSIHASTLSIVYLLSNFGITTAAMKFMAEKGAKTEEETSAILANSLSISVIATIVFSLMLFVGAKIIAINIYDEPRLIPLIQISAAGILLSTIISPLGGILQSLQKIQTINKINLYGSFIGLLLTVPLTLLWKVNGVVVASVSSTFLTTLIIWHVSWKTASRNNIKIYFAFTKIIALKLLNYGLPAVSAVFLVMGVNWYRVSALKWQFTLEKVGQYGVATGYAQNITFLVTALAAPLIPMVSNIYRNEPDNLIPLINKTIKAAAWALLPVCLALLLYSKQIVVLIYGYKYTDVYFVASFLLVANYFNAIGMIYGYAITGVGAMWKGFWINSIWSIVSIITIALLVRYGITGIACSFLISYICHIAVLYLFSKNIFRKSGKHFDLKPIIYPSLIMFAALAVLFFAKGVLYYILSAIIFFSTLWYTGKVLNIMAYLKGKPKEIFDKLFKAAMGIENA